MTTSDGSVRRATREARVGEYRRGSRIRDTPAGTWFPAVSPDDSPAGLLLVHPGVDLRVLLPTLKRLAELALPGVLPLSTELTTQSGRNWITSHAPPGPALSDVIDEGPHRRPGNAALVLRELAATLTSVHQAGLAHGRLATTSVILTPSGHTALTDWATNPGANQTDDVAGWTQLARLLAERWCTESPEGAAALARAVGAAASGGLTAGGEQLAELAEDGQRALLADAASIGPVPARRRGAARKKLATLAATPPVDEPLASAAPADASAPAATPGAKVAAAAPGTPAPAAGGDGAGPTTVDPAETARPPRPPGTPEPVEPAPVEPAPASGEALAAAGSPSPPAAPGAAAPKKSAPTPAPAPAPPASATSAPAPAPAASATSAPAPAPPASATSAPAPAAPASATSAPAPPATDRQPPVEQPPAPPAGPVPSARPAPQEPPCDPWARPSQPTPVPQAEQPTKQVAGIPPNAQRPSWLAEPVDHSHLATVPVPAVAPDRKSGDLKPNRDEGKESSTLQMLLIGALAVVLAVASALLYLRINQAADDSDNLQVRSVTLQASPRDGVCMLTATINTNGHPGMLTYRWSGELSGEPVLTVSVPDGEHHVTLGRSWSASSTTTPDPRISIQILSPTPQSSETRPAATCP